MILLDAGLLSLNGTLIAQLLIFLVTLGLLYWLAWGRLVGILEARRTRIREGIEATERAKQEREAAEREYQAKLEQARREAQQLIDQAQKMGEALRHELEAKAKAQADEIVSQAKREIEVERQRAVQDLRTQVADVAILAAGRIIGESLDAKKHRELIDRAIAEAEIHA